MKQERVILSFVMVLIGLLVAGLIFYLYQSTKVIPQSNLANNNNETSPTPTPKSSIYLILNQPSDESVVSNKTLQISGKTSPGSTVTIITASDQEVIKPTTDGNFVTTTVLDDGQNIIHVQAISPDGQTYSIERTVTYSSESF